MKKRLRSSGYSRPSFAFTEHLIALRLSPERKPPCAPEEETFLSASALNACRKRSCGLPFSVLPSLSLYLRELSLRKR